VLVNLLSRFAQRGLLFQLMTLSIGIALGVSAVAAVFAANSSADTTYYACVNNSTGLIRVVGKNQLCKPSEYRIAWNVRGPRGPQGPAGDPGARGLVGAAGPNGPQGTTGPQGPQGPQGTTGPQGPAGTTGPQGPDGTTGPQGPAGLPGPVGTTGPQGPDGTTGPQGPAGTTGPQGPAGTTGPQGPQGDPGPAGTTGPQGPVGTTGPRGPAGTTGPQGFPGTNGAQGPQGTTGPVGPQGPPGPQGTTGPSSLTGLLGSPCTRNGFPGTIGFSVDPSTGNVSLVCNYSGPLHTITVNATGGLPDYIMIGPTLNSLQSVTGGSTCSQLASCSGSFPEGSTIYALVLTSDDTYGGASLSCPGGTLNDFGNLVPWYTSYCSYGAITADHTATVTIN